MTKARNSDKHEAPRRKGHERVDAFAKTHMRGLEVLLKSKREMLKQKAGRLLQRRHNYGRSEADKHGQPARFQDTDMAPADSFPASGNGASRDEHSSATTLASRASRPAANGKQFYQHVDKHQTLDNDNKHHQQLCAHYEDEIASALRDTSLSGAGDGTPVSGNQKLAAKLANDYDYDEQACLEEALETSARELKEREKEARELEMALWRSVEDQGGFMYHTYEATGMGLGQSSGNSSERVVGAVEYLYNPDEDGETSMMGSLRASKVGDDPPPYTPF
ncbi:uncharacterized protein IWZ02DRAFT_489327 [Phyllosticta citriasiana]|uniref:uncharacterized protein n=1 Tax=Phyllosticta citriasiana TaxID=595635 RepID=UPI0030FD6040